MKNSQLRPSRTVFLLPLFLLLLSPSLRAQPPAVMSAAETELALKRLTVLGGALYVAAHPDDENTAMLAYLVGERGVRTAYLSVTRGDGGQNLIGTEKGEALGLVRTQELLAARRIDGAEQFFTRAVDFGYTKSPEEALRFWGKDEALADVVWVIRSFRPDVIISRFPATGEGGHGQHTASAVLAREAFEAAGDPSRFPEQLRHVRPWKPRRLLWNVFSFRQGERPQGADKFLSVDLGAYNPLLGKSYTEIAAQSRSMHKSQGFGSAERRGAAVNYLAHLAGEEARGDVFDGIDLSWRRVPGGELVGQLLEQAAREYQPKNPQAILPLLVRAHREMNKLMAQNPAPDAAMLGSKLQELRNVIRACAGLWVEAIAAEPYVTPGGEVRVTATLINRSAYPLRLDKVLISHNYDYRDERLVDKELINNQPVQVETVVRVPSNAEISQPYWLRRAPGKGLFNVEVPGSVGDPKNPPAIPAALIIAAGPDGERIVIQTEVLYRWVDRVRGELYRPVEIVPEVAVNLEEKVLVFPDRQPKQLRVSLRSNAPGETTGTLRLRLPAGWASAPAEVPVTLKAKGEEFRATFTITPPPGDSVAALAAEFESGGRRFTRGLSEIDYEHIPRQTVFPTAEARLVRADVRRRGSRVGYVMGSGDEIPESLRQVGYDVVLLSDEELENADLSKFDAVVTGVRAYNTRPRLRRQQKRLLEYVERGGTLVVQYNTTDRSLEGTQLGPYPFKLSQDRVTVEEAPVTLLAPEDPLLNAPNKIRPSDFDGWVQERGLYFPNDWDARYQPLFSSHDPGEGEKRGGTLVARAGRGTYVYTAYSWFRQLPAGVPGAYRLFVNMISAGKN